VRPLVSCLCVTRERVALLRRAIACFQAQTYEPREMVIVHDATDAPTRDLVENLGDPRIRPIAYEPRPSLGALRNLSVAEARGSWVAVWDDDDWYAPTRLARQWDSATELGKPANVLLRLVVFDEATGMAYVTRKRGWENSLLVRKDVLPPYADVARAEDTAVLHPLAEAGLVAALDEPDLYIYNLHGTNTWDRAHWLGAVLGGAQRLSDEETTHVRSQLGLPPG
jgi:glycosyltransferase involved in cell wall biosynthesis